MRRAPPARAPGPAPGERARPGSGADLPACRSAVRRRAIGAQARQAASPLPASPVRGRQEASPVPAWVVWGRLAVRLALASAVRAEPGERSDAAPDGQRAASLGRAAARGRQVPSAAPVRLGRADALGLPLAAAHGAAAAELARAAAGAEAGARVAEAAHAAPEPQGRAAAALRAAPADAEKPLAGRTASGLAAVHGGRAYAPPFSPFLSPFRRRQERSAPARGRFGQSGQRTVRRAAQERQS